MRALAEDNKRKSGLSNVHFLKGEIENTPLPNNSVDVISKFVRGFILAVKPAEQRAEGLATAPAAAPRSTQTSRCGAPKCCGAAP